MIDRDNGTDWDAYSMACADDTPGPALPLAQIFSKLEIPFIILSGRSECARLLTQGWLNSNGVHPWAIYLGDERHATMEHAEWKAMKAREIQRDLGVKISLHIEDHSSVALAMADIGIKTMLVHDVNKLSELLA